MESRRSRSRAAAPFGATTSRISDVSIDELHLVDVDPWDRNAVSDALLREVRRSGNPFLVGREGSPPADEIVSKSIGGALVDRIER